VNEKKRVVSGVRPTGRLHLGNYIGTLRNWVDLQNSTQYEYFYFVADLHSLTTSFKDPKAVGDSLLDVFIELMAVGIDPEKSILFLQSAIKEHCELFMLFSMVTPVSWLERNPTVKEMIRDYDIKENVNFGLLGYPILQAADITLYKGDFVPIGKDQLPHLELTREIVRRFNNIYGYFFPEPEALLTDVPYLPGLDGRKMSKTLGNAISITASEDEICDAVKNAVTDPARVYRTDKGHPNVCNVFKYYEVFNRGRVLEIRKSCEEALVGCTDCKKLLAKALSDLVKPIRERKLEIIERDKREGFVKDIIITGTKKAEIVAKGTILEIMDRFHMRLI